MKSKKTRSAPDLAFSALLLGAICIGFSPILVRIAEVGPLTSAFYRVFLALPLLWLWVGFSHSKTDTTSSRAHPIGILVALGFLFAGDLTFWHWAITHTSVANATLLANLAPFVVTLGAWQLFNERFNRTFLLGLALAICGAAALLGDTLGIHTDQLVGDAYALITAGFYGSYLLTIGYLRRHRSVSTAIIMAGSGTVTAAALLLLAWVNEPDLIPPTPTSWLVLFALAWLAHAGGQGLITYAMAHLSAAFSSISLLLQPVVAAIVAWFVLGESLSIQQLAGGVLVLVGIYLAKRGSS